jgi:hypothetical protein
LISGWVLNEPVLSCKFISGFFELAHTIMSDLRTLVAVSKLAIVVANFGITDEYQRNNALAA